MNAILQGHYNTDENLNILVTMTNANAFAVMYGIISKCYKLNTDDTTPILPEYDSFNETTSSGSDNTGTKADFIFTVNRKNETFKNLYPETTVFAMKNVAVSENGVVNDTWIDLAWSVLQSVLGDQLSTVNKDNFAFVNVNCKLHD